jgi:hypothetical protein
MQRFCNAKAAPNDGFKGILPMDREFQDGHWNFSDAK